MNKMTENKQGKLYTKIKQQSIKMGGDEHEYNGASVDDVLLILDEAKTDFPKYPDITKFQGGKAWFDALDQYDHEVKKWQQKWLGE